MRLIEHTNRVIHVRLSRRNLIDLLAKLERDDPSKGIATLEGDMLIEVSAEWGDETRRNDGDVTGPYADSNRIRDCLERTMSHD